MRQRRKLPLREAVRFGWTTLQGNVGFLVLTLIVAVAVPSIIEWGGDRVFESGGAQFLIQIISALVTATLELGLARIYLRYRDGEKPIFENLFDGVHRCHIYVAAMLIMGVAVVMGLVLLIVPGIIMMLRLWFVGFVLVDEKVGPLEAIQRSWDITRGYTRNLFAFFFLLLGINLLGAICLGVGLLGSVPLSGLAMAHIYRILKAEAAVAQPMPVQQMEPMSPPGPPA
jgi:uncharacterized membrane protein